jgi:hypothetical protein
MGWERRARGGLYYTRSRREGGRVVREYVGVGLLAQRAFEIDSEKRATFRLEREVACREMREQSEVNRVVTQLERECGAVVRAVLEAVGYHEHRGQWRRRRT